MIQPLNGFILVEPILRTDAAHEETKAKIEKAGLLMAPKQGPDNQSNFEGIPNTGFVRHLPADFKGDLKPGDKVMFSVDKPDGFKHEGVKYFAVKITDIVGVFNES